MHRVKQTGHPDCGGNAKSWPEAVIEHLVGRQGQPRGAQVYAMQLSGQKGWSQDPPPPRPSFKGWQGRQRYLVGDPCLPEVF